MQIARWVVSLQQRIKHMSKQNIKTNSWHAWFLASRPKTLTGAAAPIVIALSAAWKELSDNPTNESFLWLPGLLCLAFALMMQIDANFINDYFDFKKGIDTEERLGPQRACAQGWITLRAMKWGIILTTVGSCLVGLPLIFYGGIEMIWIGVACVVFCFLYTTTLARKGLGDVLVVLFFGIIPVCLTYYIQTGHIDGCIIALSLAIGIATDALLLVNNYRDRETDRKSNKRTLVVLIGSKATENLYLLLGITACLLCLTLYFKEQYWGMLLPWIYLLPHIKTWKEMCLIHQGKALNGTLGKTARNIFILALLMSAGILIS